MTRFNARARAGLATAATAATLASVPATASAAPTPAKPKHATVQLLSFNDYHGQPRG